MHETTRQLASLAMKTNLALLRLKEKPPQAEAARQLALHALTLKDERFPTGTTDFSSQMTKLKKSNPDLVLLDLYDVANQAAQIKAMQDLGQSPLHADLGLWELANARLLNSLPATDQISVARAASARGDNGNCFSRFDVAGRQAAKNFRF